MQKYHPKLSTHSLAILLTQPSASLSTHSLAILLTQPSASSTYQEQTIPRLKKTEMSNKIDYTLDIATYSGPKKTKFPPQFLKKQVPSLKILAHEFLSQQRATQLMTSLF